MTTATALSPGPPGGRNQADPLAGEHYSTWLCAVLTKYVTARLAPHHARFWEWVWALQLGVPPDHPLVAIFARGGAKSTSAEGGCVAVGARNTRRYVLYVCDTQDRADDHVSNGVGAMMETPQVAEWYPALARRRVGKHGNSKGWRRNRIWCSTGFVVDAIGLDVAARGVKLEDQRPDAIVLDDIDGRHDSPAATEKKITTLTQDIIPAGSDDVAVLGIQNLVIADGTFARLADGRADFLEGRQVIGPVPALRDFRVDDTGEIHGEPTWAGQDLATCRNLKRLWGLRSFRREAQHDVLEAEGALWSRGQTGAMRKPRPDSFKNGTVAVDPSGGSTARNDEVGIIAMARGWDDHGYTLADRSDRLAPGAWGRLAILTALEFGCRRVVGERNYGGDMVVETVRAAQRDLANEGVTDALLIDIDTVSASRGKRQRFEPVASLCGDPGDEASWERSILHLAADFSELEAEMTGWVPPEQANGSNWSPNRLDAFAWAAHDLFGSLLGGGVAETGTGAAKRRPGAVRVGHR